MWRWLMGSSFTQTVITSALKGANCLRRNSESSSIECYLTSLRGETRLGCAYPARTAEPRRGALRVVAIRLEDVADLQIPREHVGRVITLEFRRVNIPTTARVHREVRRIRRLGEPSPRFMSAASTLSGSKPSIPKEMWSMLVMPPARLRMIAPPTSPMSTMD